MKEEDSETLEGPFEVRTTNGSTGVARKHHSFGGANSYVQPASEEGPLLEPPQRRYECGNYETCLDLAATLNWASFTCRRCSGAVNGALQWRAHQIRRRDSVAQALCSLPRLSAITNESIPPHKTVIVVADNSDTAVTPAAEDPIAEESSENQSVCSDDSRP